MENLVVGEPTLCTTRRVSRHAFSTFLSFFLLLLSEIVAFLASGGRSPLIAGGN